MCEGFYRFSVRQCLSFKCRNQALAVSSASDRPPGQEGGPSDLKRYPKLLFSEAGGGTSSRRKLVDLDPPPRLAARSCASFLSPLDPPLLARRGNPPPATVRRTAESTIPNLDYLLAG